MPDLYTDADVQVAVRAITVARGLNPDVVNSYRDAAQGDWARAILDAIAPAIAAKALREAANDMWLVSHPANDDRADGFDTAKRLLLQRAEEIEGKA